MRKFFILVFVVCLVFGSSVALGAGDFQKDCDMIMGYLRSDLAAIDAQYIVFDDGVWISGILAMSEAELRRVQIENPAQVNKLLASMTEMSESMSESFQKMFSTLGYTDKNFGFMMYTEDGIPILISYNGEALLNWAVSVTKRAN